MSKELRPGSPDSLRLRALITAFTIVLLGSPAFASHTPAPTAVTIAGSLQSELGCPDDWQPGCAATHLAFDTSDGRWHGTFTLPAGSYEWKVATNDAWTENYGV